MSSKIWVDDDYHIQMDMGDGVVFQLVWATEEQLEAGSYLVATWGYIAQTIRDSLHRKVKEK